MLYGLLNGARGIGYVTGGLAGVPLLKAGNGVAIGALGMGWLMGRWLCLRGWHRFLVDGGCCGSGGQFWVEAGDRFLSWDIGGDGLLEREFYPEGTKVAWGRRLRWISTLGSRLWYDSDAAGKVIIFNASLVFALMHFTCWDDLTPVLCYNSVQQSNIKESWSDEAPWPKLISSSFLLAVKQSQTCISWFYLTESQASNQFDISLVGQLLFHRPYPIYPQCGKFSPPIVLGIVALNSSCISSVSCRPVALPHREYLTALLCSNRMAQAVTIEPEMDEMISSLIQVR